MITLADFEAVVAAAGARHLEMLPPAIALWQALGAHIRHNHCAYDTLLAEGYDRNAARFFVLEDMNAVLQEWGCGRRFDAIEQSGGE